jgi:hypothetical protein
MGSSAARLFIGFSVDGINGSSEKSPSYQGQRLARIPMPGQSKLHCSQLADPGRIVGVSRRAAP